MCFITHSAFRRVAAFIMLSLSLPGAAVLAQSASPPLFGDTSQPGYALQQQVRLLTGEGQALDRACQMVLQAALDENAASIPASLHTSINAYPDIALVYLENIARVNELGLATRMTIERSAGEVMSIITLGVSMYPGYVQDIINAALISSDISEQDALVAALAGGADPAQISTATAAGVSQPPPAPLPLGVGTASGGSGGGDTTSSQN